jgi:hypothetical protein
LRSTRSSVRSDGVAVLAGSSDTNRATPTAAIAARVASAQKVPRQPINCPLNDPSGTPSTFASIPPPRTRPRARELAVGPAALAAAADPTAQNAPVATAVTNRAISISSKLAVSATTT